ncbi:hypothetical protein C7M84_004794 [Penaeus vannamei]|uniref:Uncharacterized protein n=1 Tax=Penaeus vannamei TaxID=6689 RepID=A0A423TJH4_PENVA|nr:uncharacterized protein LOC113805439 [Penaeus vannamei]ROT76609.1 hypothetical protein C7M84_004794 [Penaeus vannamei]
MMGRPSPALPLLLACLACCLREVTRAATNDGAPRARDADDLDVIDVFDMAMEMRRLDHSRHDPGPELDGNFGGKFGGNGDTWLDDPSLTPTSRRKLQYSPDEIALGLQNSDYIEDVQDNPKPQRTVPVIASIGKILDDIDSKRARTQSRTAVGTTDGTTGGTTDGTTGGTTDGTTDHDFPPVFMRGGLFPQDTKVSPGFWLSVVAS